MFSLISDRFVVVVVCLFVFVVCFLFVFINRFGSCMLQVVESVKRNTNPKVGNDIHIRESIIAFKPNINSKNFVLIDIKRTRLFFHNICKF